MNFLHISASKIRVSPTNIISSLFPLRCRISSGRRRHATALYHISFPWSQDKLVASVSSSSNAWSHRPSSRAENKTLNLHHHCRLPSLDRSTPTLHCYKKVISTLPTLLISQLCLYFASSLARVPRYRSFTRHHSSFSLSSHAHSPSAQWHQRWWTSRPHFASRATYWHVNSRKKYFKILQYHAGL
jgi:hypothetical protein